MDRPTNERDVPWQALQRWGLIVGGAGLAAWALGLALGFALDSPALRLKAFYSYLFAFCFVIAVPLGSMALWMVHNQTGGAWGLVIRRVLEAATRTLYLVPLLFVPIACGVGELYPWANLAGEDAHLRELLHKKEWWLNVPFWLGRAAAYLGAWAAYAGVLNAWQRRLDRAPDRAVARQLSVLSGPGLVLYGVTVTLAAIDWLMSLEPEWYSTIYGFLIAAGQGLPALGFAVAASVWLWSRRPLVDYAEPEEQVFAHSTAVAAGVPHAAAGGHLTATLPPPGAPAHESAHASGFRDGVGGTPVSADLWNDLANLLLAAVMLWAYVSFSQLLLIWSGNLPEEIVWYVRRIEGGWLTVGIFLAAFYFGLPFVLLLWRPFKRDPRQLQILAAALVAVSVVHYFWLVNPVYAARLAHDRSGPLTVHWLDLAALAGLGGVTFAFFVWQLRSRPLEPPYVPPSEEVPHE